MLATPELLQESAQTERLFTELSRCAGQVPLYRNLKSHLLESSFSSVHLAGIPFITKSDIRSGFPANFLGTSVELDSLLEAEALELEHTSGTSEERTALLLPKGWWARQELAALNLNGNAAELFRRNPAAKRATINSPVCSGDIRYNGVPSRDNRVVGNSLFVSLSRFPFLWGEKELARIAGEILEWQPEFLDVDPVYGVVFALYCERNNIRFAGLRFVLCSYEFVSVVHRAILERVFGVPVLDLYGSTETGHLMVQDDSGEMRSSLETAFLEVVNTDSRGVGELVVSTLTNPIMPLLRYRIGDLVERIERPYGARYLLHGRKADAFILRDQNRVTTREVDQCFAGIEGVAHYQLIERAGVPWLLRFVSDAGGVSPANRAELRERISRVLSAAAPIEIQKVDIIAPEQSGKFRLGCPVRRAAG
ncbi:MAG TPA: hypothetical protein VKY92_00140 [Verrucomicrobiae bacterium]|nr:hypothetical protein [Verrucomicrobiae bacterium]